MMTLAAMTGDIGKLVGTLPTTERAAIEYQLPLGETMIALNPLLGKTLQMDFNKVIHCKHCSRLIKKTYNQGYCFPCFRSLAACDMCILKPELCHFAKGTCRDETWALGHCMRSHSVYLANTSGLKVGITRATQIPTRWIDQGAIQALPIFEVANRYQSGLVEVALAKSISDKTNWRQLLSSAGELIDLKQARDELFEKEAAAIEALKKKFGSDIKALPDATERRLSYPVLNYPSKITALNFDRSPTISGKLQGIKGQYLLLDTGVINIRKFAGYEISFSSSSSP